MKQTSRSERTHIRLRRLTALPPSLSPLRTPREVVLLRHPHYLLRAALRLLPRLPLVLPIRPPPGVLQLHSREPHVLRVAPAVPGHSAHDRDAHLQYSTVQYSVQYCTVLSARYSTSSVLARRGARSIFIATATPDGKGVTQVLYCVLVLYHTASPRRTAVPCVAQYLLYGT